MDATVFLGTFKAAYIFGTLPQICALELYRQFLRPHGLVFALTCTINCGSLYRQVWTFPNHVQSFDLPQLDSKQVEKHLKDDQLEQDAPELNFESHIKGSEYLCK